MAGKNSTVETGKTSGGFVKGYNPKNILFHFIDILFCFFINIGIFVFFL